MTEGVDAEMSCLKPDSPHMTIVGGRQCVVRKLANFADERSITEAAWKLGQGFCTMLYFFQCYYEIQ